MRYSKSAAALVAALSISSAAASPTHRHAHRHEKRGTSYDNVNWESLDWDEMGVNWAAAYSSGLAEATQAAATPTPTPTPSSVSSVAAEPTSATPSASPTASATSDSGVNVASVSSHKASLWKGLVGIANELTEFGGIVAAKGSTGDFYWGNYGSPYGHNMLLVSSRDGYSYTNEFINTSDEDMTIVVWNKVGPDVQVLSGSALAPTKPTLTFALAPGEKQIVAFQENSQVGWAQAVDEFAASGAFATSWGEVNFVKTGSGYDLSAIMNPHNNNYNMSISSTEVTCISDPTQNYWLTDTQPIGDSDGSCYIPFDTVTLTTHMGGTF